MRRPSIFASIRLHQQMIADRLRTLSYRKAIERSVKPKDVVLDLGCGTGILSFFAAKAGCRKVYAVEKEDIIDAAMETARRNGLDDKIEFFKGDIREFGPAEPIDVLVHDQIGSYVWDEGLIGKVSHVRDRFLRPGGVILPSRVDLYLVPVNCKSGVEQAVAFWEKEKYGIDFSSVGKRMLVQGIRHAAFPSRISLRDATCFLCRERLACSIDLRTEKRVPKQITMSFRLPGRSILTGMCGFFKVIFDRDVSFSTRPRRVNTSWAQFFIPCFGAQRIPRDSVLDFTLAPRANPRNWRFTFEVR